MKNKIKFSILTTTWNRANLIKNVFNSILKQNNEYIEWIVADDGSNDNTYEEVKQITKDSKIEIIYIRSDKHVGKIIMDNYAIKYARGELIIWCDSDDYLVDNILNRNY